MDFTTMLLLLLVMKRDGDRDDRGLLLPLILLMSSGQTPGTTGTLGTTSAPTTLPPTLLPVASAPNLSPLLLALALGGGGEFSEIFGRREKKDSK
jgi:hypothetical protein